MSAVVAARPREHIDCNGRASVAAAERGGRAAWAARDAGCAGWLVRAEAGGHVDVYPAVTWWRRGAARCEAPPRRRSWRPGRFSAPSEPTARRGQRRRDGDVPRRVPASAVVAGVCTRWGGLLRRRLTERTPGGAGEARAVGRRSVVGYDVPADCTHRLGRPRVGGSAGGRRTCRSGRLYVQRWLGLVRAAASGRVGQRPSGCSVALRWSSLSAPVLVVVAARPCPVAAFYHI